MRYLSETIGGNEWAELDLYLRHSRLRVPGPEVLGSDGLRLSIAERAAKKSQPPPLEMMQTSLRGRSRNETSWSDPSAGEQEGSQLA